MIIMLPIEVERQDDGESRAREDEHLHETAESVGHDQTAIAGTVRGDHDQARGDEQAAERQHAREHEGRLGRREDTSEQHRHGREGKPYLRQRCEPIHHRST
jgi:hypothetical protein